MKIEKLFTNDDQPVVITPADDAGRDALFATLSSKEVLGELLLKHGAILFRGFQLRTPEDFDACAKQMGAVPFQYVGGNSPRTRVQGEVFTSTEYPASEVISMHNEMSYLQDWPRRLFFFSQIPATSGGQTSLASSKRIIDALPPEIVDRFRTKKLNYIRNFPAGIKLGKTWQSTYQTEDRDELEETLKRQNSTCTWSENGSLKVTTQCEATTVHPELGIETWFNQAEQWHPSALDPEVRAVLESRSWLAHHCEHGDGSPLDETMLDVIRRTIGQHKLLFNWQQGDLLAIDNVLMMHGREAFTGDRRTLAFLSAT